MRVISLHASFSEILQYLECEHFLSGVTGDCKFLNAQIPQIGSPKALDLEGIASLNPDLILADEDQNRPDEIKQLEKKYKLEKFTVRSVDDAVDCVWSIGRIVNKIGKTSELRDAINSERELCRNLIREKGRVSTLVLLWYLPYITVNFNTYISKLIEEAGGWNVFREESVPEVSVDLEDMIGKEPQLLLLPKEPYGFKKRHVQKLREYKVFSKNKIELIDGKLFNCYGVTTLNALREFRRIYEMF